MTYSSAVFKVTLFFGLLFSYSLQENTQNSDGGSDGHQGRQKFVTEN